MENKTVKLKKTKGPIRTGAIIPFFIIVTGVYLYFFLFFDSNLKKILETIGYHVAGAEVNIGEIKTSFWTASIKINNIEITDSENPKNNALKMGDIRWGVLWDGLLRAKLVINEIAVEGIEFQSPRKQIGRVKPPEKESASENGNSESAQAEERAQALNKAISLMQGTDLGASLGGLDQMKEDLPSKKRAEEFEKEIKIKQQAWNAKMSALPQGKEIQALGDRLTKVKIKDFKSLDELQASLKEIDSTLKEADSKFKLVQGASSELSADLQKLDQGIKDLDRLVKEDIENLKKRFKIPSIDAQSLAKSVMSKYLDKYMVKFYHYKKLIEKYIPPKLIAKKSSDPTVAKEVPTQPHKREKGTTYEFGHAKSYPMFWIKSIKVSSSAGKNPYTGNVKGEVTHITSNQSVINKPTILDIKGDFPGMDVRGFKWNMIFDSRPDESIVILDLGVDSIPIAQKTLMNSPEAQIDLLGASGKLKVNGNLKALKNISLDINNLFNNSQFKVKSNNAQVQDILVGVFNDLKSTDLNVEIRGVLPNISTQMNSNIGTALQKGFEKQINAKIDEAKKKIDAYINEQVGDKKREIENQVNAIKKQFEGEIKKLQDQIDSQKKVAEQKTNQAKKDAEHQAKSKVEQEGKKAIEDLKKKLGF